MSKPFGDMDQEEIDLWADALLLKMHAITGWNIPEKTILFVFTDQFKKKIYESYSRVNADEFEFAFRNYGTEIKDWGKQMNLALIDEVMIPYLKKRFELSKIEEQAKVKQLPNKPESEMTMEELFETVRKNNPSIDFIPAILYDWLERTGKLKLTSKEKNECIQRARKYYHANMNDETRLEDEVREIIRNLAKKISVYDFINAEVIQG